MLENEGVTDKKLKITLVKSFHGTKVRVGTQKLEFYPRRLKKNTHGEID